ncbi:Outer membrane protein TolC [Methylobacillus rhizosphaerae]|uniref:Outer membrane protein TolC n=1 Tax=Methylobacillus rhizosphaerae TaxID=551994 RepID=A0A238YLW9_9PROT|nr:TolC family protein [Methylobacillus rhizosphaerae]SNR71613.1 Outer membrane protein TolC [Methylobacillus rhizosphaerae]
MKKIKQPPGLWTKAILCSLLVTGCGYQQYQPHPLATKQGEVSLRAHDTGDAGFLAYMREEGYADLPDTWGWRELMLCALYFHPSLDVARAQLGQALATITTASQRPNPSISAGAGRRNEPDVPEVYSLSFSIPIETAGKRQARIDLATNMSESARLHIAQTAWNLRYQLLSSWIELNAAQQQLLALEQESTLREEIVAMLSLRLQAGMISSVELSNARLQSQQLKQTLVETQGRVSELETQLASNSGLSLEKFRQLRLQWHTTEQLLNATHSVDIGNSLNPAAQDAALLNRVDIRASLANYAASEAKLRLEIARQYPDINLLPSYNYEEGFHIWSLGINSLLNVMHRNQGPVAEATALRETEAARFEALQASVIAAMDSSKSRYRTSLEALAQAQQAYETQQSQTAQAQTRFEHGFADRLELVTFQLENVIARQRLLIAEYQVQRNAAALEDSMQLPLENLAPMPDPLSNPPRQPAHSQETTS